jgi:hypothetical protein
MARLAAAAKIAVSHVGQHVHLPEAPRDAAQATGLLDVDSVALALDIAEGLHTCVDEEDAALRDGADFAAGQPVSNHPLGLLPVESDEELFVEPDLARCFVPEQLAEALSC